MSDPGVPGEKHRCSSNVARVAVPAVLCDPWWRGQACAPRCACVWVAGSAGTHAEGGAHRQTLSD